MTSDFPDNPIIALLRLRMGWSEVFLTFAKSCFDTTGKCPFSYLNSVHALMTSKYNLSLDSNSTNRWCTKLTANNKDPQPPLRPK